MARWTVLLCHLHCYVVSRILAVTTDTNYIEVWFSPTVTGALWASEGNAPKLSPRAPSGSWGRAMSWGRLVTAPRSMASECSRTNRAADPIASASECSRALRLSSATLELRSCGISRGWTPVAGGSEPPGSWVRTRGQQEHRPKPDNVRIRCWNARYGHHKLLWVGL